MSVACSARVMMFKISIPMSNSLTAVTGFKYFMIIAKQSLRRTHLSTLPSIGHVPVPELREVATRLTFLRLEEIHAPDGATQMTVMIEMFFKQ